MRLINITLPELADIDIEAKVNAALSNVSRVRDVKLAPEDIPNIVKSVENIVAKKLFDDYSIVWSRGEPSFGISITDPEELDEMEEIAQSSNPHVTFTDEGVELSKRQRGEDSLSINTTLTPWLLPTINDYINTATFIAVGSYSLLS